MTFSLSFKDVLDKPIWRQIAYATASPAAGGKTLCGDFRNNAQRDPYLYYQFASNSLSLYNTVEDEWADYNYSTSINPGPGSSSVFSPTGSAIFGVCASPAAANITLATLPYTASVGINQFANRGDGKGYYIRIIDNGAGGSGKTEVRQIIGNTAGTTPIVYFDTPLSFVPVANSHYEMLSGALYSYGPNSGAGNFKKVDPALRTVSGNLTTTNNTSSGTDSFMLMLDELYVPYDRQPGEGFLIGAGTYNGGLLGCLTATAAGAASLTGQAAAGDAAVAVNEYRNFQVRIVEDTGTPTAVGQRRKIVSHTVGPSPVYTVAAWTVTPSATAKFVIENNNDVLLWGGAATVTFSYAAGGFQADANWSTAAIAGGAIQYANPPATAGAGVMAFSCYGIEPDANKLRRHSHIWYQRSTNSNSNYYFDIAAGANGVWSSALVIGQTPTNLNTFTTGTCGVQDPVTNSGRYGYFCLNATGRMYRVDLMSFHVEPFCFMSFPQGTAHVGERMAMSYAQDGTSKLGFLFYMTMADRYCFDIALTR